jgi:hypothetical protein
MTIHIMMVVARDRPYLQSMSENLKWEGKAHNGCNLPGEDVLRMVVSQIHHCGAANRDTLGLAITRFEEIRH